MTMSHALDGLMMDYPLTLTHFFERSRRLFAKKTIATRIPGRPLFRHTYADFAERTTRLAGALRTLGLRKGDRVATFAWNSHRHLEFYWAAPLSGCVLHTLNFRLSAQDLVYIVNHAEDSVIFADTSVWPVLEAIREKIPSVRRIDHARHARRDGAGRSRRVRSAARRRHARHELAPARGDRRGRHVLHLGHHGEPEGRRVHAPGDVPALPRGGVDRLVRDLGGRHDPAHRPHVPRQRLVPAVHGSDGGIDPDLRGAESSAARRLRAGPEREGHVHRRGADDLDRRERPLREGGLEHRLAPHDRARWLGGAQAPPGRLH